MIFSSNNQQNHYTLKAKKSQADYYYLCMKYLVERLLGKGLHLGLELTILLQHLLALRCEHGAAPVGPTADAFQQGIA